MLSVDFVVVNCGPADSGGCGLVFAMTEEFYRETKRTGRGWYCPNGHKRVWGGPTTEQKLRDATVREVHLADQLRAAEAAAEAARVATARLLQRVANGVCPCCQRSFENLRRHVASQHPDLTADQAAVLSKQPVFKCSCDREFSTLRGLRIHQGQMRDDRWDDPTRDAWYRHLTVTA